jgi:hypothetical protein
VRGGQGRENETGLTNTQNSAEVGFSRLGRPTKHTLGRSFSAIFKKHIFLSEIKSSLFYLNLLILVIMAKLLSARENLEKQIM